MNEDRKEVIRYLVKGGHYDVVARTTRFSSEERTWTEALIFARGGQKALERFRRVVLVDEWTRNQKK